MAQLVINVTTKIDQAQKGLNTLKANVQELSKALSSISVNSKATEELKSLSETLSSINVNSEATKGLTDLVARVNEFANSGQSASETGKKLKTIFEQTQVSAKTLSADLKDVTASTGEAADSAQKLANATQETESVLEEAGERALTTTNKIEDLRRGYSNLITQLKGLESKYPNGVFDKTIESAQTGLNAVKELSTAYSSGAIDVDEYKAKVTELDTTLHTLKADTAQYRAENDKLAVSNPFDTGLEGNLLRLEKRYAKLLEAIRGVTQYYKAGTFDDVTDAIGRNRQALDGLQTEFQTTGSLSESSLTQLNSLNKGILEQEKAFEDAKVSAKNYHGTLKDLISGFAKFQISATIVMQVVNAVRNAFESLNDTLVETEDAIIAIKRVLDETTVSSSEIASELYSLAIELGQSFDNVVEIATAFAKAGLSWSEVLEATEAAVLALNVAELTAEESSEGLIAVMQQFGLEASELTDVIDLLNKAADKFPVETSEILTALEKVGSYASAANLELEETIALITALSEATAASGSNLGNALKSLLAYTTKSSALSTFASLSDEMAEVVSQYQLGAASILDVWEQLAIEMQSLTAEQATLLSEWTESSGLDTELESYLSDIYDSLTGVYDTAGTYRKNYFIALLNNMDTVQDVLDTIADSAGYTATEQATYMETYTAKVTALQSQWEYLLNEEQGFLSLKKGLVDIASAFLTIVEYTGGLRTTLIAIVSLISSLAGSKIITGLASAFNKLGSAVKTTWANLKNLVTGEKTALSYASLHREQLELENIAQQRNNELKTAEATLQALENVEDKTSAQYIAAQTAYINANSIAMEANAAATKAATAATKALGTTINTVLGVIGLLATGISMVVGLVSQLAEDASDARQELIDLWASEMDTASELAVLYQQLLEYEDILDKTTEQSEEFEDIQESIVDLLEDEADALSSLTAGTDEYLAKLKEVTREKIYEYALDAQAAANAAEKEFSGKSSFSSSYLLSGYNADADYLSELFGGLVEAGYSDYIKNTSGNSKLYQISIAYGDTFENYDTIADMLEWIYSNGYGDSDLYSELYDTYSEWKEEIEEYLDAIASSEALNYLYSNGIPETEEEIAEIVEAIIEMTGATETWATYIEDIVKDITGYTEEIDDDTSSTSSTLKDVSDYADEIAETLQAIRDAQEAAAKLEEKRLAVAEALEALETAKNSRSVWRYNSETGQFEWTTNEADIADAEEEYQEAIDALNEYIEDAVWDEVIEALEDGNATNSSILAILDEWLATAEETGATDVDWYQEIIDAIKDNYDIDITTSTDDDGTTTTTVSSDDSYDTGGVANGLGLLAKATNLPESVNDPELTAKILSPTSSAEFDRYVHDMGVLFDKAHEYNALMAPGVVSTAGNSYSTTNNYNTGSTINGLQLGAGWENKPFIEVLNMIGLVSRTR